MAPGRPHHNPSVLFGVMVTGTATKDGVPKVGPALIGGVWLGPSVWAMTWTYWVWPDSMSKPSGGTMLPVGSKGGGTVVGWGMLSNSVITLLPTSRQTGI